MANYVTNSLCSGRTCIIEVFESLSDLCTMLCTHTRAYNSLKAQLLSQRVFVSLPFVESWVDPTHEWNYLRKERVV